MIWVVLCCEENCSSRGRPFSSVLNCSGEMRGLPKMHFGSLASSRREQVIGAGDTNNYLIYYHYFVNFLINLHFLSAWKIAEGPLCQVHLIRILHLSFSGSLERTFPLLARIHQSPENVRGPQTALFFLSLFLQISSPPILTFKYICLKKKRVKPTSSSVSGTHSS